MARLSLICMHLNHKLVSEALKGPVDGNLLDPDLEFFFIFFVSDNYNVVGELLHGSINVSLELQHLFIYCSMALRD